MTAPHDLLDLVERAKVGDQGAFATLYRAYVRLIERVVADNVQDPEARAEVVQETFTRAFARLATLREGASFRDWLLAIARNAAIDERRLRARTRLDSLDRDEQPEPAAPGAETDEQIAAASALDLVLDCMARLSRRDRIALSLVAHLGYGPAEVGAALGISPGAAKVAVHRARIRLRDLLAGQVLAQGGSPDCSTLRTLGPRRGEPEIVRHARCCRACTNAVRDAVGPVLGPTHDELRTG